MSPELEERIYKTVLRGVLWGTERDEIFETLHTNGISGEPAEAMYRRAWDERIAFIRGESIRRAIKGALLLAAGIGLFRFFWYGIGVITYRLFIISGLLGAWGLWLLIGGTLDAIWAPAKRGSVAPEI